MEDIHESQTISKKDLREMQNHQAQRPCNGDLRKSEAQAAPGLTPATRRCGKPDFIPMP
jgi:hypothetical protein